MLRAARDDAHAGEVAKERGLEAVTLVRCQIRQRAAEVEPCILTLELCQDRAGAADPTDRGARIDPQHERHFPSVRVRPPSTAGQEGRDPAPR